MYICYRILPVETWYEHRKFNTISCLNVLDRCDRPLELLNHIGDSLAPNGTILLAIVLPFSSYVEFGKRIIDIFIIYTLIFPANCISVILKNKSPNKKLSPYCNPNRINQVSRCDVKRDMQL